MQISWAASIYVVFWYYPISCYGFLVYDMSKLQLQKSENLWIQVASAKLIEM